MNNLDIGLLALAVMALLVAWGIHAVTRQFGRDKIFAKITPGQVPLPNQPREITRVKGGREYSGDIAVAFSPPRGLTPGLVGTIVDGKAEMRDVTATIVDLAVRRYLKITAIDDDPTAKTKKDWLITKLRPAVAPLGEQPLQRFEVRLLEELFLHGDQVRMSQLGSVFAETMRRTQNDLYNGVQELGWYERHPQDRGGCLRVVAIIGGLVGGVLFFFAGMSVWSGVAGLLVAGAGYVLGRALTHRTPRTALGTAVHVQTLGFKKYLETAEADQIKFEEAAEVFSRYLPYAIVFGVAEHWAKVFGEVARRAELEGYTLPLIIDGFDGLYMAAVVVDLLDGVGGGIGLLDVVGDMDVIGMAGGAVEGLAGFAEGLGDFIDGFDIDF